MSVATFTKTGTKATTSAKLDKKVFGVKVENHELLKQAYVAYLSNGRVNLAKTKLRGEVRGGGRKPWKQKGTGRARFGSSRNPIWRGGGIVFGPTGNENYTKKLPSTAKRLAIRQALSLAAEGDVIKVVDSFANLDGKTKEMVAFLTKIEAKGRVLCVTAQRDVSKEKATKNIPGLKLTDATYLNVYDIMNADCIVLSKDAVAAVENWLNGVKTEAAA